MTNLSNLSYKELQEIAKGFNVPANLERETLEPILNAMIIANQVKQTPEQPAQQPVQQNTNPFGTVLDTQPVKKAEYVPTTRGFVSPKLLKFCMDLYKRFNMDLHELEGADYNFIRAKVDELANRPIPASEKQMTTIKNLITEINELGAEFGVDEKILDNLTGGKDGTASQLVDFLFRKRTEAQANGPLTDKQAENFVKWFYCPDIPWETFDIKQKVSLASDENPLAWRFMTPEEFTAELKSKITKSEASKFMDENNHLYYEWSKTRITQYQIDTIRELEERMANMHTIGVKEFAVVDGILTEVYKKPKRDYAPRAYDPMTEAQIGQLSTTDASKLIDQMKYEYKLRKDNTFAKTDEDRELDNLERNSLEFQQDLEGKRQSMAKDELSAVNKEHQALIDAVFKLEALVGQENEDLHESINELMIQRRGDAIEVGNEIRDFMEFAIAEKKATYSQLVSVMQNSQVGTTIVQMMNPTAYDSIINGRKDSVVQGEQEASLTAEQQAAQDFINNLK